MPLTGGNKFIAEWIFLFYLQLHCWAQRARKVLTFKQVSFFSYFRFELGSIFKSCHWRSYKLGLSFTAQCREIKDFKSLDELSTAFGIIEAFSSSTFCSKSFSKFSQPKFEQTLGVLMSTCLLSCWLCGCYRSLPPHTPPPMLQKPFLAKKNFLGKNFHAQFHSLEKFLYLFQFFAYFFFARLICRQW